MLDHPALHNLKSPRVSVIIATLDSERYLAQALESIQSQSHPVEEIILVDGGSTDGTLSIAARVEGVRILQQQSRGFARAWNEGIAIAAGDWIAFLDSDDRWEPTAMATHLQTMADSPGCMGCIGHVRFFLEPGESMPPGFRPQLLEGTHPAPMPGCFVAHRSLFEILGEFETQWDIASDIVWFANLRDSGLPIASNDHLVLEKRIHSGNLSNLVSRTPQYRKELIQLLHGRIHRQEPPPT